MAKAGRKKRVFTDEQRIEAENYALAGCQNNTIATLMDIPINTLIRHFGKILTKKRCERKFKLREKQNVLADNNPAMAIFLGKNELNQADRTEIETTDKRLTDEEIADIREQIKAQKSV